MLRPPPLFTLFPYTTLFRSWSVWWPSADIVAIPRPGMLRLRLHRYPSPVFGDAVKTYTVPDISCRDRKSTRLNSSHLVISYAVFCLKKKTIPESFMLLNAEI